MLFYESVKYNSSMKNNYLFIFFNTNYLAGKEIDVFMYIFARFQENVIEILKEKQIWWD